MPVIINQIGAPSPAPTPFPPTPAPSNKNSLQHIINPRPQPPQVATPRKHVIATALRQPLQLSNNKIEFSLPSTFEDPTASTGMGVTKVISCNVWKKQLFVTLKSHLNRSFLTDFLNFYFVSLWLQCLVSFKILNTYMLMICILFHFFCFHFSSVFTFIEIFFKNYYQ